MARTFAVAADVIRPSFIDPNGFGSGPWSMSFWFRPTAPATTGTLWASGITSDSNIFQIVNAGTNNGFQVSQGGRGSVTEGTTLNAGWNHFGFVFLNSPMWAIYQNGVAGPTLATFFVTPTTANTYIGNRNDGTVAAGDIADIGYWLTNLTPQEISALNKGARPGSIRSASLKYWWPITGVQSPEPDIGSGSANNGTVTGTANTSNPPLMQLTGRWPQRPTPDSVPVVPALQNFNAFVGRRVGVIGY